MWKRGVGLAVAAIMAFVMIAAPVSAQVTPFRDVPADHWAYDAVARLSEVNLVEGYPDGTFGGDRTFTRYEMAMVFARTLARLEQLIDERIAGHVGHLQDQIDALRALREQDLVATMDAIERAKASLAEELGRRLDAVEADVEALKRQASTVAMPGVTDDAGVYRLTPEAEAAVERVVHERIRDAMAELPERTEVIERLRERVGLSDDEVRALVRDAVAEELRRLGVDGIRALAAADGDADALQAGIGDVSRQLSTDVARLAEEFEDELAALNVRVGNLENLFDDLSGRVDLLADEFDQWRRDRRTKFSGSAGVEVDLGGFFRDAEETDNRYGGVRAYLRNPRHADRKDPQDIDDEDFIFDRTRVRQRFNIKAETQPSDGVDLVAEVGVVNDSIMRVRARDEDGKVDELNNEGLAVDLLHVALTSEMGQGEAYYGLLDEDKVDAEGFNRYILEPDRFVEPDPVRENHRGSMLAGSFRNFRGKILAVNRDFPEAESGKAWKEPRGIDEDGDARQDFATASGRRYAASAAANLGRTWTIHGGWAAHQGAGGSDNLISVGVHGPIVENLSVYAIGARDQTTEASAFEVGAEAQLGSLNVALSGGDVGAWYGREKDSTTDPDRPAHRDTFLGDDGLSHNHTWVLADANTAFLGGELRGRFYSSSQKSGETFDRASRDVTDGVDENRVARLDYGVTFGTSLPVRLDLAYASGKQHKDADSQNHFYAKLAVEDYQLSSRFSWDVSAELIRDHEIKKARHWNKVFRWEEKDKTTLATTLTWHATDRLDVYGGYKNVQTDLPADGNYGRKTENILTAGLDHRFNLSPYTRLTVGYEYQSADVTLKDIKPDLPGEDKRDPRHTIKAAIDQAIADGGNIRLEAKRISGAGGDGMGKNDATDYVATLAVKYPVARNLALDVVGHYVDSRGNKPDWGDKEPNIKDYTATEVRAGLNLSF